MNELPYFGTTGFGIRPSQIIPSVTASSTTSSKSFNWKLIGIISLVLVLVTLFCFWMYRITKRKGNKKKEIKKIKVTGAQDLSSINGRTQTNSRNIKFPKDGLDNGSNKSSGDSFGRRDWLI